MSYGVRLDAVVLWASRGQNQLFLQDDSGGVQVQVDLSGQPSGLAGERVHVEGRCVAGRGQLREALVDNDGVHRPLEQSGIAYLTAGRHPVRAEWFNGAAGFAFRVEYQGPGLPGLHNQVALANGESRS